VAATRDVAGRRYALAIIDIAKAEGAVDSWLEAADTLEALTGDPRFVVALQADGVTDEKFVAIVRQALPGVSQTQINLFRLLRRKGRLALGPSIASYLRELVDEDRGVLRALVTTAVELDADRVRQVREQIAASTGQQVELETRVDPTVLGGMVIRIGDRLIDGSTRGRLRKLRESLERAAV
jgi:F-type H+-transporting ATPase subunit delta